MGLGHSPLPPSTHPFFSSPPHQGWLDLPVLALFGDPKQLPPTINSIRAIQLGYKRSLLERLSDQHIMGLNTNVGVLLFYATHSSSPTSTFTSFAHPHMQDVCIKTRSLSPPPLPPPHKCAVPHASRHQQVHAHPDVQRQRRSRTRECPWMRPSCS